MAISAVLYPKVCRGIASHYQPTLERLRQRFTLTTIKYRQWRKWIRPMVIALYILIMCVVLPFFVWEMRNQGVKREVLFVGGLFTCLTLPLRLVPMVPHLVIFTKSCRVKLLCVSRNLFFFFSQFMGNIAAFNPLYEARISKTYYSDIVDGAYLLRQCISGHEVIGQETNNQRFPHDQWS